MTQGFDDAVNGHKSNLTKSMKDFGEGGRIHHLLRDIDLNICDYEYYFNQGKKSRQAEIDAITKQRDSFIKAHHIAMNDVCEHKAKIDELQARVDETLKILKDWDDQSYRDDMDQLTGEIEDILKGNRDENIREL